MKKILFVINTMSCAGAETALIELLKCFDAKEYEVSLFVLMEQGEMLEMVPKSVKILNQRYSLESVLTEQGKKVMKKTVWRAFWRNGKIFAKASYILKQYCQMKKKKKVQFDKILWRVLSDGAQRIPKEFDLAVAYLEGGSTYYVADYVHAKKKASFVHIDYESSGYTKEMDRDCFDKMDRIFMVSDEVKQHFLQVYPQYEQKARIFHNIINQDKIKQNAKKGVGFVDSYEGVRLLTVGRLNYQKAYDIAIDALKILKDAGYQVRWYVIGEGEEREKLEKKCEELGLKEDFCMIGKKINPFPFYAQCDIYMHVTRFEGKSIAIQEAQTLGCPIIASNCNGNREQITDKVDGILCELTPKKIAESILLLLKDEKLKKQIGQNAAKKRMVYEGELEQLTELLK